jgi:hypothetical protein
MNKHILILLIGLALLGLSITILPVAKLLCLHGPVWIGGIETEIRVSAVIVFGITLVLGVFCSIIGAGGDRSNDPM